MQFWSFDMLNCTKIGYQIKADNEKYIVSHLLHMDDLKMYAQSITKRTGLMNITELYSKDKNMKFGLDKCRGIEYTKWES